MLMKTAGVLLFGALAAIAARGRHSVPADSASEKKTETVVSWDQLPAEVRKAAAPFVTAETLGQAKHEVEDGIASFELEYRVKEREHSITLSPIGELLESEHQITLQEAPAALRSALAAHFPNAGDGIVIESVQRNFFEVEFETSAGKREVSLFANGTVLDDENPDHEDGADNDEDDDGASDDDGDEEDEDQDDD